MSTALVLRTDDEVFALAERICRAATLPAAYRGKPIEAAVAILYGQELGMSPMTALNRVVVIEGKPAVDAQGMVALIRAAGHSLTGESSATKATAIGKRFDNGDEMSVSFTIEEARAANLANKGVWKSYPKAMLWARAVSQLARQLFADVLMGISYTPEEADFTGATEYSNSEAVPVTVHRAPPVLARDDVTEDGEIVDAEVVDEFPVELPVEAAGTGPKMVSKPQINKMLVLFGQLNITDRQERLDYLAMVLSKPFASSKDLTMSEAKKVIDVLIKDVEDGEKAAAAGEQSPLDSEPTF